MKTILEVLEAVDTKLDSPEKWTKGWYAKNKNGNRTAENNPAACCWCLIGAVISVAEDPSNTGLANEIGKATLDFLSLCVREDSPAYLIHTWNDDVNRTFTDVKNLIKQAKEKLIGK